MKILMVKFKDMVQAFYIKMLHPEVKIIGFLMWLCAGITSLSIWISFKYSHLINKSIKVIVTMLKQRSQSAGNFCQILLCWWKHLRDFTPQIWYLKISVHVPNHLKPISDTEFGHYLAGLIDGDGHFSKTPQLVVVFNELDASLSYYIKGKIGYGNVYKVKNKKSVILLISKQLGIRTVLNLINGIIRSQNKLDQIKNNILLNPYFKTFTLFSVNTEINLNNHWFSGFFYAEDSFQINFIKRNL